MNCKLLSWISLLVAAILDGAVLRALLAADFPAPEELLRLAAIHLAAMGFVGVAAHSTFVKLYPGSAATSTALVVGLCAPAPFLGVLFFTGLKAALAQKVGPGPQHGYVFGTRLGTQWSHPDAMSGAAQQSVLETLHSEDRAARRQMILALSVVDRRRAMAILRRALQDSDEVVRLLAHAQFDRPRREVQGAARSLERELAGNEPTVQRLVCLAECYAELMDLSISQGEPGVEYWGRSLELLAQASRLAPRNQRIQLLCVEYALKKQDLTLARHALQQLQAEGCPPERLLLFEAELHFLARKPQALTQSLAALAARPPRNPSASTLLEFWQPPTDTPTEAYA
jgi:hypothetical protein